MYVCALIISNWSITKLYEFLTDYLNATPSDILYSKIEKYKNKSGVLKDSNKTLFLLSKKLFDAAIEEGFNMPQPGLDFRISEFTLNAKYYPYEGYTGNLFLNVPKFLSVKEVETFINDRFKTFAMAGLLPKDSYTLKIPLESRTTGEHKGFLICNFAEEVDIKSRTLVKILLQNSFICRHEGEEHVLPVLWARKQEVKTRFG